MDNNMYILIDMISLFPQTLFVFWLNTKLVPVKNKKSYIISATIITNILYFLEKLGWIPLVVRIVLVLFFLTGYIMFFSVDKKIRQVGYVMINYIVLMFAETIFGIIYYITNRAPSLDAIANPEVLIPYRICSAIVYYLFESWFCKVLKRNTFQSQAEAKGIHWYIPVFMAEFLIPTVFVYQCSILKLNIWSTVVTFIVNIIIVIMFVITYIFMYESEKRESENYKTRLLHVQVNEQEKREAELSEQVSKAEDIRTNILDGLAQAQSLLAGEKAKDACSFLGEIVDGLWVGSMYSTNRVVDAVVSAKAKICEEKNIDFECELPVPDNMHKSGIKNAELCAVFANLLDNGIRACDELCDDKRPFIRLYAKERGGYLTIRQENSYDSDRKERKKEGLLPEHGLGLGIIESLAAEHEGRLKTQAEDGVYTTRVTLKLENS